MRKNTLPRHYAGQVPGWAHPYDSRPFAQAYLYADGGDDDDSASSSDDDGGDDTDDGDADDDGDDDDDGKGQAPKPKAKAPAKGKSDDADARIARLEKDLAEARREAGKSRTEAKKQAAQEAEKALAKKVAVALGLVEDEDARETDPAKLLEQLKEKDAAATSAQEDAVAARIELSVIRTAYGMGVDGDKLLDSRKFCDEIDELDPSDPKKFKAALKAAIKDAAEKNPALRTGGGKPARSGGDLSGGTGEGARKRQSLSAALRDRYGT